MKVNIVILVTTAAAVTLAHATGWREPVKLNANVNFGDYQWGTSISPDGNTLYFSSHYNKNMDIYRSRRSGGDWGPAEKIAPGNISTDAFENDPYIHWDNKTLYFVTGRDGSWDIWYSVYNGGWSAAEPVPGRVNTANYNEFNLCIAPDGRNMYFSSDRPGGPGGWCIWKSEWTGTAWGEPSPLGPSVNSGQDDYAPKLTADGRFMYFNSGRWGLTLEMCVAGWNGTSWGNVRRLPSPPNSAHEEFDASIHVTGNAGVLYFVSSKGGPYEIWASEFEGVAVAPSSLGRIKALFK
jgi:Tol biopolymer transport system component